MIIIARPRIGGKTFELITEHFLPSDSILVVPNKGMRESIIKDFNLLPSEQRRILVYGMTTRDIIQGLSHDRRILVDNADIILRGILGGRDISVITVTGEYIQP